MAPVSNACWGRQIASVTPTVPEETESSSAEVQLDKGYLGRQCANGAPDGPEFVGDSFPNAHWTLEPSLVCTKDSHKLFPGHPECFH